MSEKIQSKIVIFSAHLDPYSAPPRLIDLGREYIGQMTTQAETWNGKPVWHVGARGQSYDVPESALRVVGPHWGIVGPLWHHANHVLEYMAEDLTKMAREYQDAVETRIEEAYAELDAIVIKHVKESTDAR